MSTVQVKYGKKSFDFILGDKVEVLTHNEPRIQITPQSFVEKLSEKIPKKLDQLKSIGIVIADKTRLCDYPIYLPLLIKCLKEKGAKKEAVTIFIAYGTHKRQSDQECMTCYGEIYEQYKFIHHDCKTADFTRIDITKAGTPIEIRKDIPECSLLITFGAISHHYFAGYGGGIKLLFPGLSSKNAIYRNHSLFLDREKKQLAKNCQPGILRNNPIAADLKEIDEKVPERISIHGLPDSSGQICDVIIGKTYEDFLFACEQHDKNYRSENSKSYDVVIASGGGYPKDINFIQAHKAIHNAAAFVKKDGKLIMFMECIDGISSDKFMEYFSLSSSPKVFEVLSKKYEGNGGTALSLMSKTKRIQIYIISELSNDTCTTLGMNKLSLSQAQTLLKESEGTKAFIQNASVLVK